MGSTTGRPRRVTDAQIQIILAWRAEIVELKARRKAVKTIRRLAHELEISTATISDVVRKNGFFKQPAPELRAAAIAHRRALLSCHHRRTRRRAPLTEAQSVAIEQWWRERRALLQQMQSIPTKADIARELGVARGTLDRMLARQGRHSEAGAAAGGARHAKKLGYRQLRRVHAWKTRREAILARRARVPGARVFAGQLGVGLSTVLRTITRLNQTVNS